MRMRWTGHAAHMRGHNAYRVLVGKPEAWGGMDWIHLTQGRDQWQAVRNITSEPVSSIKCWKFLV
jgi:hypothetical protein